MRPEHLVERLAMSRHPEGGWYAETYRSAGEISAEALPPAYTGRRSWSTAIYYLLAAGEVSRLHRLESDEILHHYGGDTVEVLLLHPDGHGEVRDLGIDLEQGAFPQIVVPSRTWFGFRVDGSGWALLGATVAPGFDWDDFEIGDHVIITSEYPDFADFITSLSP